MKKYNYTIQLFDEYKSIAEELSEIINNASGLSESESIELKNLSTQVKLGIHKLELDNSELTENLNKILKILNTKEDGSK